MAKEAEQIDWDLLEKSCVEAALPAYMLQLMAMSVISKGYQLRADTRKRLDNAAAVALSSLADHPDRVVRAAQRVEDVSRKLLFALSPDDPIHGLYCCAMFALKLIDENRLDDPQQMAVIVSMQLLDELKEDTPPEGYRYKNALLVVAAGMLLSKAINEHGLYNLVLPPRTIGDKPLSSPPI